MHGPTVVVEKLLTGSQSRAECPQASLCCDCLGWCDIQGGYIRSGALWLYCDSWIASLNESQHQHISDSTTWPAVSESKRKEILRKGTWSASVHKAMAANIRCLLNIASRIRCQIPTCHIWDDKYQLTVVSTG